MDLIVPPLRAAAGAGVMVLLAACSTTRLPDAPKTIGAPVKANPHYKIGSPYEINGRRYTPKADPEHEETGVASWYGDQFHGRLTANGEIFDKRRLSAAHRTLPMPTIVEVENLENGRTIRVRVNDRGPFARERVIDLSHAAADALGFTAQGTARVRVRYVGEANIAERAPLPGEAARAIAPTRRQETQSPALAADASDPIGALISKAAGSEFWVEVAEIDDVSKIGAMRLYVPGEGPVALHSQTKGERSVHSARLGPFFNEAVAAASLSRALAAGFGAARIVRGAGE